MSDNIEVRDGMLFESTETARVNERFVVGQDERHTVPLVSRWLALGTVRSVPTCGAICPDRLIAAGKPCGEPRGHGPETMHRVDLGCEGSSSWADIETLVAAAKPSADSSRLGEIQCLAYELGAVLRGTMVGDALALVDKIGALTLPVGQSGGAT